MKVSGLLGKEKFATIFYATPETASNHKTRRGLTVYTQFVVVGAAGRSHLYLCKQWLRVAHY